jgi:hypothetical protein
MQNVYRPVMNTDPHVAKSDHSQHTTCFVLSAEDGLTNQKEAHISDYMFITKSRR